MYAGDDFDQIYLTSSRDQAKGNDLNAITGMKSTDIFMAKKNEKKQWESPEPLESEVNSEFEDGPAPFLRMVKPCILLVAAHRQRHRYMLRYMPLHEPEPIGEHPLSVLF